jgi:hypothetical protein
MSKNRLITGSLLLLTGALLALPSQPASAQRRTIQPERRLLGISLGSSFLQVIRRYGQPSEIQTVALSSEGDQLPGLGGGASASAAGGGGMFPGMAGGGMMPGGGMGGPPMRGSAGAGMYPGMAGGMMGGGMSAPVMRGGAGGGIPSLPPVGGGSGMSGSPVMRGGGMMSGMGMPPGMAGGMPGGMMGGPGMRGMGGRRTDDDAGGMMGGMPGMGGMGGAMGGAMGGSAATNMPEYSTATLWIYKRPNDVRLEFLINEDGRVAQISAAAPANQAAKAAAIAGARTARGVTLGTPFSRVTDSYGYPERFRMLPGLRFYETYFTKNYHAAFTFDTLKNMKCVRITIALAD